MLVRKLFPKQNTKKCKLRLRFLLSEEACHLLHRKSPGKHQFSKGMNAFFAIATVRRANIHSCCLTPCHKLENKAISQVFIEAVTDCSYCAEKSSFIQFRKNSTVLQHKILLSELDSIL